MRIKNHFVIPAQAHNCPE